jgi:hypothetical protein
MKNKSMKFGGAAVAALALAASVQAIPITGGVSISGAYTADTGHLQTASELTITLASLNYGTGSFSGGTLQGSPGLYTPVYVNQLITSPNYDNLDSQVLWSVKNGSTTYDFTVTSELVGAYNSALETIGLSGAGTITDGNVNDMVYGTWQLTFGQDVVFSWEATSGANVPDGGATAMLLGAALSAVGLLRRKLVA